MRNTRERFLFSSDERAKKNSHLIELESSSLGPQWANKKHHEIINNVVEHQRWCIVEKKYETLLLRIQCVLKLSRETFLFLCRRYLGATLFFVCFFFLACFTQFFNRNVNFDTNSREFSESSMSSLSDNVKCCYHFRVLSDSLACCVAFAFFILP